MSSLPSVRMLQERPPSAEETFRRLVGQAARDVVPAPAPAAAAAVPSRASVASGAVAAIADGPGATDAQFREIFSSPENQIFKVVFFPDRIFHAQYLNATRAPERYRYAVSEARSVLDISVLKAQVFLDGRKVSNLLRIEYRGSRLVEMTRESGRFLRGEVIAWVKVFGRTPAGEEVSAERPVKLHLCPWINAYQVEIWETLETPVPDAMHHFQVLAQMGPTGAITRVRGFAPILADLDAIDRVELAFRESDVNLPYGTPINEPRWDNNYERNFQAPRSPVPSDSGNTVPVNNYLVCFQKGWYLDANTTAPVRYRNAMMENSNPDWIDPNANPALLAPAAWHGNVPPASFASANVIEMRWILQRELGGSTVFFHEVTIPPGTVEGTHCHVGSEELYYITEGEGLAYMAEGDDPATGLDPDTKQPRFPVVERHIFGLFPRPCVELPVGPGKVIFTKSGGVHGIRNTGERPLKFVAFLYHSV
jgi:mannose-6-phosphate isomerase-like protein (cupin superfamily)